MKEYFTVFFIFCQIQYFPDSVNRLGIEHKKGRTLFLVNEKWISTQFKENGSKHSKNSYKKVMVKSIDFLIATYDYFYLF